MIDIRKIIAATEFLKQYEYMETCPECNGKRQDIFDLETPTCKRCSGWGKVPKEETEGGI
jgi:DnaJ-class molecular chaperone